MKKQAILLVVLVALVAVVLMQRRQQQSFVAKEPAGSVALDPDRVSRVLIQRPGEVAVELVRIGGGWRLQQPFEYKAQDPIVNSTLTALKDLELSDVVSSNPDKRANFDVDDSTGTHVQAWEGDTQVMSLVIGKAAPDFAHTFVRHSDGDEVYRAVGMLQYSFNKKADDWRDKTILALHQQEVVKVELRYPGEKTTVLTKQDSLWTAAADGGNAAAADSATVANLLRAASHLNTASFASAADLEGKDLSTPDFEFYLETDSEQHEIHFWKTEDNRYFARLKDDDSVTFSLYESSLTRIQKKLEDFEPTSS